MPNMVYANTDEALAKIMGIIAEAYTLQGADIEILDRLQDMITVHFQRKAAQVGEAAASMARYEQAQPEMGGGGMAPQGVNPGGVPMRIGPGGGAGNSGYGSPNPDELRRVLGGTGTTV